MNYGRHTHHTTSWMAILALTVIAGCHATHSLQPKHAPAPPPVFMEYPYFGYHPTCWARWPADWVGCPPDACLPLVDAPLVETVPLPDSDLPPRPPMPPAESDDTLPPAATPDASPDDEDLPPAPPADIDEEAAPALQPSAQRMPRSLRMQLRSPSRAATNRGIPAPPRVSLNSYSSTGRTLGLTTRHDYGLARLARQAAVRRSRNGQPVPPSINELVGAESEESADLEPAIKVGALDTTPTTGG